MQLKKLLCYAYVVLEFHTIIDGFSILRTIKDLEYLNQSFHFCIPPVSFVNYDI